MRIIGITKVGNEREIIQDTLDHWGSICTGGIYVYDDMSGDGTYDICNTHLAVKDVIKGDVWHPDRERAEHLNRQRVLKRAQKDAKPDDWFVYFDADERLMDMSLDFRLLFDKDIKAIACKLFDYYITEEDEHLTYKDRKFLGPEYRTIVFFFRNSKALSYNKPDQRIVNLPESGNIAISGRIGHYGKAISVQRWEDKCDYYINHWPKYAEKWKTRKGKAVKYDMKSDFGNDLIQWHEAQEKGIQLELMSYGKN